MQAQTHAKKVDADIHFHDMKARSTVFGAETGRINAHTQQAKVMIDAHLKSQDQQTKQDQSKIGGDAPKPKKQTIGQLHQAPVGRHPVHGLYSEKDIGDTMRAHGMTRHQVMAKLAHHAAIHNTIAGVAA